MASRIHMQPDSPADWSLVACDRAQFVARVEEQGILHYRDLAWRNIGDAYGVLVSEVMLQQTQVARVLKFWPRWMALFPTIDALAAADTASVLEQWQGLGYNRRALALKRACEECSSANGGQLPQTVDELQKLPGIGPATAAGIVAFAHDKPALYLETNVRSVFLHELFPDCDQVKDRELAPFVADACPQEGVRAWYYALLDYGAFLKTQVANPSRRSAHYARQSAFPGSRREKRSFVLKCVLAAEDGIGLPEVLARLDEHERAAGRGPVDSALAAELVDQLVGEGFFRIEGDVLVP